MAADMESFFKSFLKLVASWGKDLEKISSKLEDLYKQRDRIAADYSGGLFDIYTAGGQLQGPAGAADSDARDCEGVLRKVASLLMPLLKLNIKAKFTGRPKWLKVEAMGVWTTEWIQDIK